MGKQSSDHLCIETLSPSTRKIKITVDPEEQSTIRSLLQSALETLRPEKPYTNKHLDPTFLCNHFPPETTYIVPEDVFVPVFPRNRQIARLTPVWSAELTDFRTLMENVSASFEQVDVMTDDDNPRRNLMMVDGWRESSSALAIGSYMRDRDNQIFTSFDAFIEVQRR